MARKHFGGRRLAWTVGLAAPLVTYSVLFGGAATIRSEQKPITLQRMPAPASNPVVAIAQGKDYAKTTLEAINRAGGLASLVKAGSTVFIKINIVGAAPSGVGKITDWRVTQAVVNECLRLKAAKVVVGEAPVDDSGFTGFSAAGYDDLKGAELMLTSVGEDECRLVVPERSMLGQPMFIPKIYLDSDVVIDIPVMKIHGAAGVTLGLKNVGIGMPSKALYTTDRGGKWALHDLGMDKVITEVSLIRRPDFVVVDGMVAGEGEGPNNPTPLQRNLVFAGRDVVAVDTVGSLLMGVNPEQVTHLAYAAAQGIGVSDMTKIQVVGKSIASVRADFIRPTAYGHPYKRSTTVRRVPAPMQVDGDLAEWAGAWENRIGDGSQFTTEPDDWRDCSARTMVMHDLENLYFAFKVNDGMVVEPAGDGVELLLSFDMPFVEDTEENLGVRTKHTPGKDFILTADYAGADAVLVNRDTKKPVDGAKLVFRETATGYIAEGLVPLASLSRRPLEAREEIWLDFGIIDIDEGKANRALWNDGTGIMGQYSRPAQLGRAFIDN